MQGLPTRNPQARTSLRGVDAPNRPRTPGLAYSVLTVTLAVLLGALALTSRQTAPPTIAEFAPQAVEQITESAGDDAGSRGRSGLEASAADEGTVGNEATTQGVDVARVRQCVGDPPRQIEDPQSPPCVPYWSGDNGGATTRGVTRDEIRVTHTGFGFNVLEAFFNKRFELYGRRIRVIPRTVPIGAPAEQRAAARAVYEQDQAFASTGPDCEGCHDYYDELARLGIVGVHFNSIFPESYLDAHRPYVWTYPMANDRMFALTGDWYCARFAGRNALHAGDPVLQAMRRKLGIILMRGSDWDGTSVEPMNAQLGSCGERTDAVFQSSVPRSDYAYYAAFMENAMLQMKTRGVTTVACLCNVFVMNVAAMRAATNQGYFPEWIVTSYLGIESSDEFRLAGDRMQMNNLMLLLTHPMERAHADHPSTWAVQEVSNQYPAGPFQQWALDVTYWSLLLLASGFQMAGPRLTPETFERGLHKTRFSNPPHRIMAGAVGFKDGDHSMTDDAAEMWWSNSAQNPDPDEGPGAYCYVDHGARRHIGTFPTDDPFFRGPCDNGTS